jgi:Fe-S-cluster containining protein
LKEQQRIEAKGFVNFLEADSRNIRTKKNGDCFFLTEGNLCKIQDVKPSICVMDPFVITDFNCETNRIFVNLNPLAIKNCKGIFSGEMIAPEEIGKAAQTIVKEFLEIVAKKTGLPATDKKVTSLTRKLLLHL